MNRISLVLASILAGACTDDPAVRQPLDPHTVPVRGIGTVAEPVPEAPRCIPFDGAAMYGTLGHDELRDVAVTRAGAILLAGFDGNRGIVLEYDGTFATRATLETVGTDSFESLAIDDVGRTWLAGRTNAALASLPSYGSFDYVVGELGPSGFHPMARGFDTTPEYVSQLAVSDGLVAIAGHEQRIVLDGATWINPIVATFAAGESLAPQWLSTRRSADAERYTAIDVSPEMVVTGGAIATGATAGMFVMARDRDAGTLWSQRISTLGGDELAAVHVLPNGDVLWAGTTSAALGDVAHGGTDIAIGRLDGATGAPQWTYQYGSDHDERAADLAVDLPGHIFVAGDVTTQDRDAFVIAIDESGSVRLDQTWSSTGDDVPTALALDACGTAVLAGYTTGDFAGASQGGRDGFVLVTRGIELGRR